MGYTHYWTIDPNRVSPEQFLEIAKDTMKIIKASEVKITREYNSTEPAEFGEGVIRFNGYDDAGYETFVLDFTSTGTFCKTAQADYDEVVTATLLRCHVLLGDAFTVSSDGEFSRDWELGVKLYNSLFDPVTLTDADDNWSLKAVAA